jgi:hypothetical protein
LVASPVIPNPAAPHRQLLGRYGAIILSNYRKYYTYNNDIVVADPFFLINILVFLLH